MDERSIDKNVEILISEVENLKRRLIAKQIQLDAEMIMEAWYAQIDSIDTDYRIILTK